MTKDEIERFLYCGAKEGLPEHFARATERATHQLLEETDPENARRWVMLFVQSIGFRRFERAPSDFEAESGVPIAVLPNERAGGKSRILLFNPVSPESNS